MKKRGNKGFSLVELMIVIGIMVVLIGLIVGVVPKIWALVEDVQCKNNLTEIYKAIQLYKTRFGQFPDRGGDLFLAKLYYTKYLTKYEAFICPSDKSEDKSEFTDETAEKCHAYEKGVTYDTDDGKKIPYNWEEEEEWEGSWRGEDRTFKRTEISYAARWNLSKTEKDDEPEGWEPEYEVTSASVDPTIIVCDDMENAKEKDAEGMIHDDHINALFSDGSIRSITGTKMGEGELEAMKN